MRILRAIAACALAAGAVVWSAEARAQRLYNRERDDQSQAALKIAETLQTGALFDKQLKNAALVSKRNMETSLAAAHARMRADINSFTSWSDVNTVVSDVDKTICKVGLDPDSEGNSSEAITKELTELGEQIKAAKAAFEAMKKEVECRKSAGTPDVDTDKCPEQKPGQFAAFFERAEELDEILQSFESLTAGSDSSARKNVLEAAGVAKQTVAKLKELYDNIKARMDDYHRLEGELLDLQLPLKRVALDTLQVEEQRLKNILKIRLRREVEEADILDLIDNYRAISDNRQLGFKRANCRQPGTTPTPTPRPTPRPAAPPDAQEQDSIEMSLRDMVARLKYHEAALDRSKHALVEAEDLLSRAAGNGDEEARQRAAVEQAKRDGAASAAEASRLRDEIRDWLHALHMAAAISARGLLPKKLADLRESREERAYSIRRSAVAARGYQAVVAGGVRRLSLYHKGGIKPSVVARLLNAASNVAIPPAILSQ